MEMMKTLKPVLDTKQSSNLRHISHSTLLKSVSALFRGMDLVKLLEGGVLGSDTGGFCS